MTKAKYDMFGDLSTEFKDRQFSILLFPCNQFLSQEPKVPTAAHVLKMSGSKLDITSDMANATVFDKVDVNGCSASPVFQYLRYNSSLYDEKKHLISPIPWNFGKFLVDSKGGVFKYYDPKTTDDTIRRDIEVLLAEGAPTSPSRRPSVAALDNGGK